MRIVVLKERKPGENRVALMPDLIPKLIKEGFAIHLESGAGVGSQAADALYSKMGGEVFPGSEVETQLSKADFVLSVQPLTVNQMMSVKPKAVTLSFFPLQGSDEVIAAACERGITAFAMELIPRISRAQSMDALTSQALCAGYRAALVAAELSPRFFPLLMTAAGTVTPAQVLVLGAGVAGLQAIATARRLGAVVSAYDVRPSSADEVRSMGASFIELELESLEGSGGYAREMSEERAAKQRELLKPYISKSHVVITTAAVPNRAAPLLITKDMYSEMADGSVIVDLASESGGNVEGSRPSEIVTSENGVIIWGGKDVASQLPFHASSLYAKNLLYLLELLVKNSSSEGGENRLSLNLDFNDEIIEAAALVHEGERRK